MKLVARRGALYGPVLVRGPSPPLLPKNQQPEKNVGGLLEGTSEFDTSLHTFAPRRLAGLPTVSSQTSRRRSPSSWPSPWRERRAQPHRATMAADELEAFAETDASAASTPAAASLSPPAARTSPAAARARCSSLRRRPGGLRVEAEADEFTAFALHPSNPSQLVTAARNRQLVAWALDLDGGPGDGVAGRTPAGERPRGRQAARRVGGRRRRRDGLRRQPRPAPASSAATRASSTACSSTRTPTCSSSSRRPLTTLCVWSLGESSCLAVLRGHVSPRRARLLARRAHPPHRRPRRARLPVAPLDHKQAGSIAALEPLHALLVVDADADAGRRRRRRGARRRKGGRGAAALRRRATAAACGCRTASRRCLAGGGVVGGGGAAGADAADAVRRRAPRGDREPASSSAAAHPRAAAVRRRQQR